jgi:hypothetical protein
MLCPGRTAKPILAHHSRPCRLAAHDGDDHGALGDPTARQPAIGTESKFSGALLLIPPPLAGVCTLRARIPVRDRTSNGSRAEQRLAGLVRSAAQSHDAVALQRVDYSPNKIAARNCRLIAVAQGFL